MFRLYTVEDIPITKLLHDDKYAYKKEGHGGKPVEEWPIYHFFKLYHSCEKEKAESLFVEWYIDQYRKYANVNKSKGGMRKGSLDRLYKDMKSGNNVDTSFREAVVERVKQRFQLLESILSSGYKPRDTNPVRAFMFKNGYYMIFGGNHRVAVLAALDYELIPNIYVYKNNLSFIIHKIFNKLI